MSEGRLPMKVALNQSSMDARRGVVRVHPAVLEMLEISPWEPLSLTGSRTTAALAAAAPPDISEGTILVDDITCDNAGIEAGGTVWVARGHALPATEVLLSDPPEGTGRIEPATIRFALLGKTVTAGDKVSLLPQDYNRPSGSESLLEVEAVLHVIKQAWGDRWRSGVCTVASTAPQGLVRVTMETVVGWKDDQTAGSSTPLARGAAPPAPEDLPGLEHEIKVVRETLELAFRRPDLVARLGATPPLGVLVTGPPGSGKVAMVTAAAAAVGARVVRLWSPSLARAPQGEASSQLLAALADAEAANPGLLLLEDVEAIAPKDEGGPLSTLLLELIQGALERRRAAIVCTTAHPEATSPDLRGHGLLDVEIELSLPGKDDRRRILEVHSRPLPLAPDVRLDEVAARTPGFVAADLMALCREAAMVAAQRALPEETAAHLQVEQRDFVAALELVRPTAMLGASVEIADVELDEVGDMEVLKNELIETLVWPLRYPESFERLGIDPPSGVLLYGPPGCGKTFLVKALANEAEANFLAIKGAELLSKWVGESERGVRELFRRARGAAPAVVFFDEVDALAPARGASHDSGTTDRVVAQLLTELDGVEELHGVFVLAATNRPDLVDPALLRPGRLERALYVPPPDAGARGAILASVTKRMPCDPVFDAAAFGASCEGFSAADLAGLARRAALLAMRESMDAPMVAVRHFEAARQETAPSLRREQIEALERWAAGRGALAGDAGPGPLVS